MSGFVLPGQELVNPEFKSSGNGTFREGESYFAALAGKSILHGSIATVEPFNSRFKGSDAEAVVGRVKEVGLSEWRVDIDSQSYAILPLSAILFENEDQRVKSAEDRLRLRDILAEGDVIYAETTKKGDGSVSLNFRNSTENQTHGKLSNGELVKVPPRLVKDSPSRVVNLVCNVQLIIGANGWIWLCPSKNENYLSKLPDLTEEQASLFRSGNGLNSLERHRRISELWNSCNHTPEKRLDVARVHNIIKLLAKNNVRITVEVIENVYRRSLRLKNVFEILTPEFESSILPFIQRK